MATTPAQNGHNGRQGRPRRPLRNLLLLAGLAAAIALPVTGHTDLLIAGGMGLLVMAVGLAVFRSYSSTKGPVGPPEDVEESGTLLMFACGTCGEQLILLRKGTDAPPRHCADAMVLRRVPTSESLEL